jgi:hypothetical protein
MLVPPLPCSEPTQTDSPKGSASITSTSSLLQKPSQDDASGEKAAKPKSLLQKLKEENEKRKEKVQHVSHEEAERITGYGENTAEEKAGREKKGTDSSLAALFF